MNETKTQETQRDTLRCFTLQETADRLHVHISTVYRLMKEGKLNAVRIGRHATRISEDALAEFLYNQSTKKPEPENTPKRRIITKIV